MPNPFEAGFLKKIQEVQANLARAQEQLKDIRVEGSAAGSTNSARNSFAASACGASSPEGTPTGTNPTEER